MTTPATIVQPAPTGDGPEVWPPLIDSLQEQSAKLSEREGAVLSPTYRLLLERLQELFPVWSVELENPKKPVFRHHSGLSFPFRVGFIALLDPSVIEEIAVAALAAHKAGITCRCGVFGEWLNHRPGEGYGVELRPKKGTC